MPELKATPRSADITPTEQRLSQSPAPKSPTTEPALSRRLSRPLGAQTIIAMGTIPTATSAKTPMAARSPGKCPTTARPTGTRPPIRQHSAHSVGHVCSISPTCAVWGFLLVCICSISQFPKKEPLCLAAKRNTLGRTAPHL